MSDSSSKSSIPQWQQQDSTPSPTSDDKDTSRAALVEQASKFLQDDSIRDAPTDRKISFLESKGLTSSEIDSLLGVSRNPEASSSSAEEDNTTAVSPSSTSTSPTESSVSTNNSTNNKTTSSTPRDVAPIITYPEFLLHQSKPPPLVTLRSVLYTLYGAASLGASIYGVGEYIVKPMLATLTSARHDLAETAEENLKTLNEKLEQNVSRIPPTLSTTQPEPAFSSDTTDEDLESITSDPTELFHRDIGTQTSQDLVQDQLSSQQSSTDFNAATGGAESSTPDPTATVTTHQKRLEAIGSHLRELTDTQNQSDTLEDTTQSRINDLQRYLDGLLYSKNTYSATSSYGVYTTPGLDSGSSASTGVSAGEESAISSIRAEIRGVKGILLSARNFPSSRGGRIGGSSFAR